MSMEAVGGYFKGLRETRDMTTADVAAALKTLLGRKVDTTTVWRVETARQNPGSDLLLGLVSVLGGRLADIEVLFQNKDATSSEGEALGSRVARGEFHLLTEEETSVLERLNPDQRRAALNLLRQMLQDS